MKTLGRRSLFVKNWLSVPKGNMFVLTTDISLRVMSQVWQDGIYNISNRCRLSCLQCENCISFLGNLKLFMKSMSG